MTPKDEMEMKRRANVKEWEDTYFSCWYNHVYSNIGDAYERNIKYARLDLRYGPELTKLSRIEAGISSETKMDIASRAIRTALKDLGFTEGKDIEIQSDGPSYSSKFKAVFI